MSDLDLDKTEFDADPSFHDDSVGAVTDPDHKITREDSIVPLPATSSGIHETFTLVPGAMLGDYRIEHKLGEGGMGIVLAAVHPLIGKQAAIKVLKKDLCEDASSVARFVDEARAVNAIGHPNIVDIFAFGQTTDGRSYYVMEWLKGVTLREQLAHRHLRLDEVCAIARPLTRALEAAHGKGIIHRDLKPENVFLVDVPDEPPIVKLLDFGIAKLADRNDVEIVATAPGQMIGTPTYCAPEQARGLAIDHRVDIYALGCIIYEMITNEPPFIADNPAEMISNHLLQPAKHPSQLVPEIPHELDDLVVAMLAKEPAMRPSLADVANTLDEVKQWTPGARTTLHVAVDERDITHRKPPPVATTPAAAFTVRPRASTDDMRTGVRAIPTVTSTWHRTMLPILIIAVIGVIAGIVIQTARTSGSTDEPRHAPAPDAIAPTPDAAGVKTSMPNATTGVLKLKVTGATGFEVLVDDQLVTSWDAGIGLDEGTHEVQIRVGGAIVATRTVKLVANQIVELPIEVTKATEIPKTDVRKDPKLKPKPRPAIRGGRGSGRAGSGSAKPADDEDDDKMLIRPNEVKTP